MSTIDTTKPAATFPTTDSVRENFRRAAEEIDGLGDTTGLLASAVFDAQAAAEGAQAVAEAADGKAVEAGLDRQEVSLVAGLRSSTQSEGTEVVGADVFNPASRARGVSWTRTIRFRAVLAVDDGAGTAYAALYNLTDGVRVCELSTQATTPTELTEALSPGVTAGFPNEEKTYEVRVRTTAERTCFVYKCCLDVAFSLPVS